MGTEDYNFYAIISPHNVLLSSGMRGLPALLWDGSVLDPG